MPPFPPVGTLGGHAESVGGRETPGPEPGADEGAPSGPVLGTTPGPLLGTAVGVPPAPLVGAAVGATVGATVGTAVGAAVGAVVGAAEGTGTPFRLSMFEEQITRPPPPEPEPLHWLIVTLNASDWVPVAVQVSSTNVPPLADPLHCVIVAPVAVAGKGSQPTVKPSPEPTHWLTVASTGSGPRRRTCWSR